MEEAALVRSINEEALLKEYYEILKIVGEFDGRLMTVKGWGVTLSLAALAWGFQHGHYGLFLIAALSGLGFWLIEGTMKRHQMRFYPRMREIEVLQYQRGIDESTKAFSTPRIDSSWSYASVLYAGKYNSEYRPIAIRSSQNSYRAVWFFPHVFLPHLVSIIAGFVLLAFGIQGSLGSMTW